jgi:hypothetical protein
MASSSVPALKRNLQTQLQARPGLSGVQISYGAPLPDPQREFIALLDVEGDQRAAALGAQRRVETYVLTVVVNVIQETTDQRACTERCYTLAAELENQLRADATVNGAVRIAQIWGPFKLEEFAGENTRAAQLRIGVHCDQRI